MEQTPPVATVNRPALALDKERRVAYIVATDGLVAEVSLDAEAVRYHAVRGRFAKLSSGSSREALFVDGRIVVTGSNSETWKLANDKPAMRIDPAGLEVIDTATWQVRRLADGVSSVFSWPGGFLATGGSWTSVAGNTSSMGVAAYGRDGVERFRLFEGKRIWVFAVYGGLAYVHAENEGPWQIIELVSGRVVASQQGQVPWLLLEENAAVW
jgi:hypothetical protein